MLTLKHLLHPLRTARKATNRLRAQVEMRRFAARSKRHFRGDPRYNLSSITDGFAPRFETPADDTCLLQRICRAYARTVSHPDATEVRYQPTEWWAQVRARSLGPVMRALREGDIDALRRIYANLFRDPCATGLVGLPYGAANAYFRGPMRDVHRHCYLGDTLYQLDYWLSLTGGRFDLRALAGPGVGNPFGVCWNGTLVPYDGAYQHYCAQQILGRLDSRPAVVGEIGGAYGGVAHYLIRDGGRLTYIGFDLPESTALTSYYLLKSFPSARSLLFGERDLTPEALTAADIVLLPLFAMPSIQPKSVNLMFSSHVMADLSDDSLAEYLGDIERMTKDFLVYSGDSRAAERISKLAGGRAALFASRETGWHRHKAPGVKEGEYLYRIAP